MFLYITSSAKETSFSVDKPHPIVYVLSGFFFGSAVHKVERREMTIKIKSNRGLLRGDLKKNLRDNTCPGCSQFVKRDIFVSVIRLAPNHRAIT